MLVVLWSVYELYPPKGRDLVQVFREKAVNRDVAFSNILFKATSLQKTAPDRAYENLVEAVGTNDLTRYFPMFEAKSELHPNAYILNRLQRDAAGRIKLGLDLQGGTQLDYRIDLRNAEKSIGNLHVPTFYVSDGSERLSARGGWPNAEIENVIKEYDPKLDVVFLVLRLDGDVFHYNASDEPPPPEAGEQSRSRKKK